jgi:hypothetical protein
MVPNSPTMTGKDSIAKTMKDVLTDPNWSLALQPVQVEPMCSLPPIRRPRRR